MAHLKQAAAAEQDGSGQAFVDSADFMKKFNDVEVQILAMEATELRI